MKELKEDFANYFADTGIVYEGQYENGGKYGEVFVVYKNENIFIILPKNGKEVKIAKILFDLDAI